MTALTIAPGAAVPLRHLTKHMLITGATGTGKTTTAGAIVERLAAAGVPVLALDAKGDLETLTRSGGWMVCPFGERGERRALNIDRMGPDFLARAMELSEAQSGALLVAFSVAESEGFAMDDLADLRSVLNYCVAHQESISARFGLVSPASVAAVQRALLALERNAAEAFGNPPVSALEAASRGGITVIAGAKLCETPGLYGAFAAHILDDLYRRTLELGNVDKPALAVLIDEAHLIFDGASPAVVRRIEQIARLIRSKGVALIFATQSPADLPDTVSGQLLTRIQHGLRATTPAQLRALKAAADSMPTERGFDAMGAIGTLGVGQALVSLPTVSGSAGAARIVNVTSGKIDLGPLGDSEVARDRKPVNPRPVVLDRTPAQAHYVFVPVAAAPRKPRSSKVWWLYSGLGLVAFYLLCSITG